MSGDTREELMAIRNLKEKNTCTPKTCGCIKRSYLLVTSSVKRIIKMDLYCQFTVSKVIGWQLCSDVTYPFTPRGFPPLGPVLFTLRLQKLDKSLKQYLLEAAYTFVPKVEFY